MNRVNMLDVLKKARDKKEIKVDFEIQLGDVTLKAILTAPDYYSIWEEQNLVYQEKLAEYKGRGLDQFPINLEEWESELEQKLATVPKTAKDYKQKIKEVRKQHEQEKPRNLAEQQASKFSRILMVQKLLPKFLRHAESNEPLFETPQEQAEFTSYVKSDPALMRLLANKYLELINAINAVGESAKN